MAIQGISLPILLLNTLDPRTKSVALDSKSQGLIGQE